MLYFTPLPLGIMLIIYVYSKCHEHIINKVNNGEMLPQNMDKEIEALAGGTVNLCLIWVFISLIIGLICVSSD